MAALTIAGFSPPKGIRCFSTGGGFDFSGFQTDVSVPRRGFVVFLQPGAQVPKIPALMVSVPRRGFVVFLRGYHDTGFATRESVSVPRRGFVVFLPGMPPLK